MQGLKVNIFHEYNNFVGKPIHQLEVAQRLAMISIGNPKSYTPKLTFQNIIMKQTLQSAI